MHRTKYYHKEELILDRDDKGTIIIAAEDPTVIRTLTTVLENQFRLLQAPNAKEAMALIETNHLVVDLIIIELHLPDSNGYEFFDQVRSHPENRMIPFIFITNPIPGDEEGAHLAVGAVDYLFKPLHPGVVKARIQTQIALKKHKHNLDEMVAERTTDLVRARKDIVQRLTRASETRDNETGMHTARLSHLCGMLGTACGMSQMETETLSTASLMHDIGKIGIPDAILLKPGNHTPEETAIMQTHTTLGGNILANPDSSLLVMARDIALAHHEQWDGSGYPFGLKGEEISLEGRITSVCDVFDALTSQRPYKQAWTVDEACDYLKEKRGTMFDPSLVNLFIEHRDEAVRILGKYQDTK